MRPAVPLKDPTHLGRFAKCKIIELHGISVTEAAQAHGTTRPALSALLNGRAHLSPEMDSRIEKAIGLSLDALMRMQNSFVIARVRKRTAEIAVARFKPKGSAAERVKFS